MSGGKKFDDGKPRVDLIPYDAEEEIGKVFAFGAKKYDDENWKKGIVASRLVGSAKRHIGKFTRGQDLDEESSLLELAHAASNIMMLIWMMKNRPDMDDRYTTKLKQNNAVLESGKVDNPFSTDMLGKIQDLVGSGASNMPPIRLKKPPHYP